MNISAFANDTGVAEPLDILIGAVEQLAGAQSELEVAAIVRTAARRLTGADGVSVVLKEGHRVHYVDEDAVGPLWKGQDFPMEACISGWAIKNRQTVVIEDIRGDPRIPLEAYAPTFVKSLAMAPVGSPEPIAAIGAYWGTMRRPTENEVEALEAMARAAFVAMENVRLRRELRQALSDALSAERAKNEFLTRMGTEIRTPMRDVTKLVELLDNTALDPRQKQICALLRTATEDSAELVCDILELAGLEAGRSTIYPNEFDLVAAVRTAATPHFIEARTKKLSFEIVTDAAGEGIFVGDAARLQKIVDILVGNAVKHTDEGGIVVRLEEEERVGVRSMFKISVIDTGVGFQDASAQAMFERFSQGQAPRGGLGLGLAIAEAISRLMGGGISASGASGVGSTFAVRIPLERPMPPSAGKHSA